MKALPVTTRKLNWALAHCTKIRNSTRRRRRPLSSSARSGHEGVTCNDKKVGLALGDIHVELMNWDQFDQMKSGGKQSMTF